MDDESRCSSPLWNRGRPEGAMSPAEMREVQMTPEWLAAKGLITAAEYLMMFGDYRGPVELLEHEGTLVGPPKPRLRKR
jgi:hypothetical protein